jgi:hypothetical protein
VPVPEARHQLLTPSTAADNCTEEQLHAAINGPALRFSATKYPTIRAHMEAAIAKGWPRILVLNRSGADERRGRLLENIPTRPGFDRDEYPPAVGRGRANASLKGLVRGINPIGWLADVMYVPSSENRSHGSTLGAKLRGVCDGVRFRYVFAG